MILYALAIIQLKGQETNLDAMVLKTKRNSRPIYYIPNQNKPYTGVAFQLDPMNRRVSEFTFKRGKMIGQYKKWYASGMLSEIGYFDHLGKKTGNFIAYYENGKIKTSVSYKKDKLINFMQFDTVGNQLENVDEAETKSNAFDLLSLKNGVDCDSIKIELLKDNYSNYLLKISNHKSITIYIDTVINISKNTTKDSLTLSNFGDGLPAVVKLWPIEAESQITLHIDKAALSNVSVKKIVIGFLNDDMVNRGLKSHMNADGAIHVFIDVLKRSYQYCLNYSKN